MTDDDDDGMFMFPMNHEEQPSVVSPLLVRLSTVWVKNGVKAPNRHTSDATVGYIAPFI